MDGELRRWEREDEPSIAGVDGSAPEHVAEERPDLLRLAAVEQHVHTIDHRSLLVQPVLPPASLSLTTDVSV
jgi:hypothetical protein